MSRSRTRAQRSARSAANPAFEIPPGLSDPAEVESVVCRLLAEQLGVDRAYLVRLDDERGVARVGRDQVRDGITSLAGEYEAASFGAVFEPLRAGNTMVVRDAGLDPRISDEERMVHLGLRQISLIAVGLRRDGELAGALCVSDGGVRDWSDVEVARLEEATRALGAALFSAGPSEPDPPAETLIDFGVLEVGAALESAAGPDPDPGSSRWVDLLLAPAQGDGERLVRRVVGVRDATADHEARAALAESERRFRATFDAMNEGVTIVGFDWRILYENEAARRFVGAERGAVRDRSVFELRADARSLERFERFRRAMEERVGSVFEEAVGHLDGTGPMRWLEFSVEPHPDGILVVASERTERRAAEAALAASEERYRFVVENIADVTAHVANDGTPVWISQRLTDVLGWHPDEWIGRSVVEFVHPDDLPVLRTFYAQVETSSDASTVVRVRTKAGDYRWIAATSRPFRGSDDTVAGRAVTFRDVTDLREAQIALAASEQRYRTLVEGSSDVVFRASGEALEWISPQIERLTGRQPAELQGLPLDAWWRRPEVAFVHPDDVARVVGLHGANRRGERARAEVRVRHRNGSLRWVEVVLEPGVDLDGRPHVIGSLRDIEAVVSAREVAEIDRSRLRSTLDALIDPHLYLQPLRSPEPTRRQRRRRAGARGGLRVEDFVVLDANPAAFADVDPAGAGLLGTRLSVAWEGLEAAGWLERLARVAETGEAIAEDDVAWPDGRGSRWFDLRASRVGADVSLTWRDVSERHQAVERRSAELEARARRVARRADYLAQTEHALRTNLSVVESWTNLISDPAKLADPETMAAGLAAIERNARILSAHLRGLLSEATQAARAELIEPVLIDAAPLVRAVVDDYAGLPDLAAVTLSAPGRCLLLADETALDTVLRHLVENAGKFAGPEGAVEVELRTDGEAGELIVRDDGPGLPEGLDVFAAFSRDGSTAGHGLGLHVARTLVEAMGGEIEAHNRPDRRGACFIVSLHSAAGEDHPVRPTGRSTHAQERTGGS